MASGSHFFDSPLLFIKIRRLILSQSPLLLPQVPPALHPISRLPLGPHPASFIPSFSMTLFLLPCPLVPSSRYVCSHTSTHTSTHAHHTHHTHHTYIYTHTRDVHTHTRYTQHTIHVHYVQKLYIPIHHTRIYTYTIHTHSTHIHHTHALCTHNTHTYITHIIYTHTIYVYYTHTHTHALSTYITHTLDTQTLWLGPIIHFQVTRKANMSGAGF